MTTASLSGQLGDISAAEERADLPVAERRAAAQRLRDDFAAASPLSAQALLRVYARRGWWLRALRLRRAWGVVAVKAKG